MTRQVCLEIDPDCARQVTGAEGVVSGSAVEVPPHIGHHGVRVAEQERGVDHGSDHPSILPPECADSAPE
jgi:hypothetical protein